MFKVYLAGAITGLTADVAQDWREEAKEKLAYTTTYDGRCVMDTNGDGDCPRCTSGIPNPPCKVRTHGTGIVGYSPMRAKDYLLKAGVLSGRPEAYDDYILSTAKGITYRDSWDVATADLVLINLMGAEKVSIGTVLEIGMAYAHRKPIVAAWEEDNIHNHAMVNTMVGWICPSLDYAIDITKAILLPDGVRVPA